MRGGGCSGFSYDYTCANGKKTSGGGGIGFSSPGSGGSCGNGGGSEGGPSYRDWFGGGSGGESPDYTPIGGESEPLCLGGCNSSACSGGDNGNGDGCN